MHRVVRVTGAGAASSRIVLRTRRCALPAWGAALLVGLGGASLACSRADSQRARRDGAISLAVTLPAMPAMADSGYRTTALDAVGRVTGSVEFDGPVPADSLVHPVSDADVCGQTLADATVEHRGPRLANAVVWLTGVVAGKHMPYARRYDITTVGCRIVPRVQAVAAGGTLDVGNGDPATHETRYVRAATGAALAAIQETEAGAVVPSTAILAMPGLVEIRCERHPWMRGWLAVFDHPYFTTTDANGIFVIDSVPPGRYEVSVWHERFGTRTDSVKVTAGQDVIAGLRYTGRR